MAIKLADVIENNNAEYPVVEAYNQTILGLYNGFTSEAQQALQLYYDGESKEEFAVVNSASNGVKFAKLPYLQGAGSDNSTVGPGDARALLTIEGGLFITKDSKLYTDTGGNDTLAGVYVHNVVTAGNAAASNDLRSNLGRASELVQQFNRYESLDVLTLDNTASLASIIENDEDLWLAGYDAERNRMRKFGLSELFAVFATELGQELVDGGIVSTTDAGGTGAVGDLNGDGIVSVADLLILMGSFGGGNESENYVSKFRTLTGQGDTFVITPSDSLSNSGSGDSYQWGDIDTFDMPAAYSVNNAVYGWDAFNSPLNAANYLELESKATGSTAQQWFAGKRLRAVFTAKVQGPVPDYVFVFLRVRITMTGGQKYEQVYYMNPIGSLNNSFLWYGNDFNSTPGEGITVSWFYSSNNEQFSALDYEASDAGVTESGIMQDNTWTLTSSTGNFISPTNTTPGQIDDIELRFGVYSFTGLTDLSVARMDAYVDEEAYDYIHPQ